ncbi:histidine phosphatase family protein [Maribacter sp. SA7]|uniref:SixA phosphatase family protein n=1 Tax=Maribacter zhoushanensis TaxID=3030012 RepID=UPI0023EC6EAE|nr:histidine phosphatase family protein [Maribacter zhoushanensis]MDF4204639.1 histidine phosphatase family protein [Maribacter zhoushanensis]
MKNLFLMRHGKSSWELNVSDQDRALLQRGISDARLVADEIAKLNLKIDQVYTSPANRAFHTCMICLRTLYYPLENCSVTADLYDFSGNQVFQFIQQLDNNLNNVLLFGHNHTFTHLANSMGDRRIDNVPTSGFVHLQFQENTWANVIKGSTIQTIFPKQLKA